MRTRNFFCTPPQFLELAFVSALCCASKACTKMAVPPHNDEELYHLALLFWLPRLFLLDVSLPIFLQELATFAPPPTRNGTHAHTTVSLSHGYSGFCAPKTPTSEMNTRRLLINVRVWLGHGRMQTCEPNQGAVLVSHSRYFT